MDSREILPETEEIYFLLDTESLNKLSAKQRGNFERFLRYSNHDTLHYLRTPDTPEQDSLSDITRISNNEMVLESETRF